MNVGLLTISPQQTERLIPQPLSDFLVPRRAALKSIPAKSYDDAFYTNSVCNGVFKVELKKFVALSAFWLAYLKCFFFIRNDQLKK